MLGGHVSCIGRRVMLSLVTFRSAYAPSTSMRLLFMAVREHCSRVLSDFVLLRLPSATRINCTLVFLFQTSFDHELFDYRMSECSGE